MKNTYFMLVLIICASKLDAQHESNNYCEICVNGEHTNEAPYIINLKKELPFLLTGASLVTTGLLLYQSKLNTTLTTEEIGRLNSGDINSFDHGATDNFSLQAASNSDIFRTSVTFFPVYFLTNFNTKGDIGILLAMTGEVFLTTFGLTQIAKNAIQRPRPYMYNAVVSLDTKMDRDDTRSFFSGHTSHTAAFSFFMAKVINDYHQNSKKGIRSAIWVAAAAIPMVTGYLRVKAGKHFPSDVITGYLVGAAVGVLIPHLHRKDKPERSVSLLPVFGGGYAGVYLRIPIGKKLS